jgi:hypothetical protein
MFIGLILLFDWRRRGVGWMKRSRAQRNFEERENLERAAYYSIR